MAGCSSFVNPFFLHSSIWPFLSLSALPYSSPPVHFLLISPFFVHSSVSQSVSQKLSQLLCLSVCPIFLPPPLNSVFLLSSVYQSIVRPSVSHSRCLSDHPHQHQFNLVFPLLLCRLFVNLPPLLVRASANQSVSQSVSQSLSVRSSLLLSSILPSLTLSPVSRLSPLLICLSVRGLQSVSQSVSQSVTQSISQSINQSVSLILSPICQPSLFSSSV